jgi:hypothetical protein
MSSPVRNTKKRISLKRSEVRRETGRSVSRITEEGADEILGQELSAADIEEFREFMASGEDTPEADPLFKERLRRELWWSMVSRSAQKGNVPES